MNINGASPWQVRYRLSSNEPWSEARYALRERAEDHADRLVRQKADRVSIIDLMTGKEMFGYLDVKGSVS